MQVEELFFLENPVNFGTLTVSQQPLEVGRNLHIEINCVVIGKKFLYVAVLLLQILILHYSYFLLMIDR